MSLKNIVAECLYVSGAVGMVDSATRDVMAFGSMEGDTLEREVYKNGIFMGSSVLIYILGSLVRKEYERE